MSLSGPTCLARRVIPCLDVSAGRMVKGVRFENLRDQGDPAESALRYAEQGADEIVFLDIGAAPEERDTDIEWVRRTAEQVFIPLTVGGGVRSEADARRLLRSGADKVGINSAAVERPELIGELARRFGSQCVVLSVDARRQGDGWEVVTRGGRQATGPAPLAGAAIGGPFTLADQDGRAFSSTSLAGKYSIFYFGYTFCPDACPTDMAVLGKALRTLDAVDPARSARIQPVFVTVDPARDTPPVLKQFVRAFHPRLIGLTGSDAQIAAVAKAYAVTYRKQSSAQGTSGYLMDHPRVAILFGPDGKPIELLPVDAGADAVVADLKKWVA